MELVARDCCWVVRLDKWTIGSTWSCQSCWSWTTAWSCLKTSEEAGRLESEICSIQRQVPSQLLASTGCPLVVLARDLRRVWQFRLWNHAQRMVSQQLCYTPIWWIADGLYLLLGLSGGGGPANFQDQQLDCICDVEDVFHPSRFVSMFRQEFILMDVSLNQTFTPINAVSAVKGCLAVPVQSRNVTSVLHLRWMGSF